MKKELSSEKLDLTGQECSILRLIAAGQSTKKIADKVCLGVNTILWYRKRLYAKLDVHSVAAFATEAHRRGRLGAIAEHLGIREGCRIAGLYRLTIDDLRNGSRFDDGICPVGFMVDVHDPDRVATAAAKPRPQVRHYQIPYRALVPEDADNLLLCGRLLSGDFHAHASYRVICNMMAVGEAVGRAAGFIVAENASPRSLDGRRVKEYMRRRGYQL